MKEKKKKAGQLLNVTMEARPALSLPKTTVVLLKKQLVRDVCALQFHREVLNTSSRGLFVELNPRNR